MNHREKDRERLENILAAQEYTAVQYSVQTNRCTGPQVKMTFLNILGEEHRIQNELYGELQRRGWGGAIPAQEEALKQLREEVRQRRKNAFQ